MGDNVTYSEDEWRKSIGEQVVEAKDVRPFDVLAESGKVVIARTAHGGAGDPRGPHLTLTVGSARMRVERTGIEAHPFLFNPEFYDRETREMWPAEHAVIHRTKWQDACEVVMARDVYDELRAAWDAKRKRRGK